MWWHQILFKKSPFSISAIGKDLWSSNGGLQQNHQSVTQPLSQTGPPPISWSLPYSFYFFATLFSPFAILYPIMWFFSIILYFPHHEIIAIASLSRSDPPPISWSPPLPYSFPIFLPIVLGVKSTFQFLTFIFCTLIHFIKLWTQAWLSLFNQAFKPSASLFSIRLIRSMKRKIAWITIRGWRNSGITSQLWFIQVFPPFSFLLSKGSDFKGALGRGRGHNSMITGLAIPNTWQPRCRV